MKKLEITTTPNVAADISESELLKVVKYCQYALMGSETAIMLEKESDTMVNIRYDDKIRSCTSHIKIKSNILLEINGNSGILMYPEETTKDISVLTKAMDQIIIPKPEKKVYVKTPLLVDMTIPVPTPVEDITFEDDEF